MNRNYLPPALALQNNYKISLNQSPSIASGSPSYTAGTFFNSPANNSFSYSIAGSSTCNMSTLSLSTPPSAINTVSSYTSRRIYGKACKLPPVQEIGKFLFCICEGCFFFMLFLYNRQY